MADAAVAIAVGEASDETQRLIGCAERAFAKSLQVVRAGISVRQGLVITVEPIIAAGSGKAVLASDGWTVRTRGRWTIRLITSARSW
jgi:triosephosphate isomerase